MSWPFSQRVMLEWPFLQPRIMETDTVFAQQALARLWDEAISSAVQVTNQQPIVGCWGIKGLPSGGLI